MRLSRLALLMLVSRPLSAAQLGADINSGLYCAPVQTFKLKKECVPCVNTLVVAQPR